MRIWQALRKNVTSKKGITCEALDTFEKFDFGGIVYKVIQANITLEHNS